METSPLNGNTWRCNEKEKEGDEKEKEGATTRKDEWNYSVDAEKTNCW